MVKELIPPAIDRLMELYREHEAAISDAHANMLFWQIVSVENDMMQAAGFPYDGPPLDSLRAQEDFWDAQQQPAEYGTTRTPNW
jgi:hypothetical protein